MSCSVQVQVNIAFHRTPGQVSGWSVPQGKVNMNPSSRCSSYLFLSIMGWVRIQLLYPKGFGL